MQGRATISLTGPDTLSFNVTLNRAFDPTDLLQSILLSVPAFINSSAVTLAQFYGPNVTNVQMVRFCLSFHFHACIKSQLGSLFLASIQCIHVLLAMVAFAAGSM